MKRTTKTMPVSFRMGIHEKRMLEDYCDEKDLHFSEVIREAVSEYLQYLNSASD